MVVIGIEDFNSMTNSIPFFIINNNVVNECYFTIHGPNRSKRAYMSIVIE
jgi:hypothetical protein